MREIIEGVLIGLSILCIVLYSQPLMAYIFVVTAYLIAHINEYMRKK